ncbi:MAG: histidine phosphatase family protein [Roseiarcus sp.]
MFPYSILFIRHGETSYNAEGRLQGQRDIPLNGKGREQASAVGRTLKKLMPTEIARLDAAEAFIASPLLRTRETMDLARTAMGLAPRRYRLDPTLMELSFGDWEGLTWPEIEARDPAALAAREADKWDFVPTNGESYAMLCQRLRPWLATRRGDVFVASHGGVARAFLALIAGVKPGIAAAISIWQGRAIVFEKGGYRWLE